MDQTALFTLQTTTNPIPSVEILATIPAVHYTFRIRYPNATTPFPHPNLLSLKKEGCDFMKA